MRWNRIIPDDEGADRYLPWVVAVMLFLAELAVAAGLAVNGAAQRWEAGVSGSLTVEMPAPAADSAKADGEARLQAVADALRAVDGVIAVNVLPRETAAELLRPWLGSADAVRELALPRLIDVTLEPGRPAPAEQLEAALSKLAPEARVDDHKRNLAPLMALADGLRWLALAAVALAGAALSLIVVFGTRATLAAHRRVVELLHLMGATDETIARRFLLHAAWLGLRGGMVGLALAAVALFGLSQLADGLDAAMLGDLSLSRAQLGVLALLPLAAAVLGGLTARWTVLRELAGLP